MDFSNMLWSDFNRYHQEEQGTVQRRRSGLTTDSFHTDVGSTASELVL